MKRITLSMLFMLIAGAAFAGKPALKPQGLVVTQNIFDQDANFVPYSIQSDGTGVYKDGTAGGVTGDVSVMMGNVCNGLTYGDRLLDLTSAEVRQVKITLTNENALQPEDFGYQVPAQQLGTVLNSVRLMNKCTCGTNQSMYTMTPGSIIYCPMHLRFSPFPGTSDNYVLDMGNDATNGSEKVQITCNSSGSDGFCNDWSIDPSSDPDFTVNPGKVRAQLNYSSTYRGKTTISNRGSFYLTFHMHVSRP